VVCPSFSCFFMIFQKIPQALFVILDINIEWSSANRPNLKQHIFLTPSVPAYRFSYWGLAFQKELSPFLAKIRYTWILTISNPRNPFFDIKTSGRRCLTSPLVFRFSAGLLQPGNSHRRPLPVGASHPHRDLWFPPPVAFCVWGDSNISGGRSTWHRP